MEVEVLRGLLYDMEAHDGYRAPVKSADALVADLALLLVLTSRALMV